MPAERRGSGRMGWLHCLTLRLSLSFVGYPEVPPLEKLRDMQETPHRFSAGELNCIVLTPINRLILMWFMILWFRKLSYIYNHQKMSLIFHWQRFSLCLELEDICDVTRLFRMESARKQNPASHRSISECMSQTRPSWMSPLSLQSLYTEWPDSNKAE